MVVQLGVGNFHRLGAVVAAGTEIVRVGIALTGRMVLCEGIAQILVVQLMAKRRCGPLQAHGRAGL